MLLKEDGSGRRKRRPGGTEVGDLPPELQGAAHGILGTPGRPVEPSDEVCGMVDEKVVADAIDAAMVTIRQDDGSVGESKDAPEPHAILQRKQLGLSGERNDGDELQTWQTLPASEDGLGGAQIEPDGHAAQKCPRTPVASLADNPPQRLVGTAAISTVAGKSDGSGKRIQHAAKITHLARTLQKQTVNPKISTIMKNTGLIITSLLGGLIVGSALTMLFTPQSGMETRKQIKDFLNDEIDKMKQKVEKVHEQIEEARCKCGE